MVGAVVQIGGKLNHREAGNSFCHSVLQSLFHGRVEVFRHGTTHDRHGKGQTLFLAGRKADLDVSVLSGTAVLFLVLAFHVHPLGDALTVSDLRRFVYDVDGKAVFQLCRKHCQVHIAQTVDQHLLGLGVILIAERQVFLQHLGNALGDLALVLGGHRDHRLAHIGRRVNDLLIGTDVAGTQRVVGVGIDELCNHADVAAGKSIHFGLRFAEQGIDVCHFFTDAGGQILQRHIPLQLSVHDFEERHLTHKGVGNRLEYEECAVAVRLNRHCASVCHPLHFFGGVAGEGFADSVQQSDNAPDRQGRAAVYRHDRAVDNAVVERLGRLLTGDLLSLKILVEQILAGLRQRLVEGGLVFLGDRNVFRGHFHLGALAFSVVAEGFHFDQIQHGHVLAGSERNEHGADRFSELFMKLPEYPTEICVGIVTLVDKERTGNARRLRIIPRKLGADLHAGFCVHADHGVVGNPERLQDFSGEIQISGGVQNIDLTIFPRNIGNRSG